MTEPLIVRPATAADGPAIVAIDAATLSADTNPTLLGSSADSAPDDDPLAPPADGHPRTVLVAQRGGEVLGYLALETPRPGAWGRHVRLINGLAVDPAAQRQGVASALLSAAVDAGRAEGARKLSLRVLSTNPGAQALYARAGFVVEGVLREEFRTERGYVDDVLMALLLG